LPDDVRLPVNLSLIVNPQHLGGSESNAANFGELGILDVGHGALLDLDIGARLALRSSSSIVIDGALNAPGGTIDLTVTNELPINDFLPSQGIALEDGARLSATGAVRAVRNDLGELRGTVLPGGSITLLAQRGYVSTAPGSVLDVSGTAVDHVLGAT